MSATLTLQDLKSRWPVPEKVDANCRMSGIFGIVRLALNLLTAILLSALGALPAEAAHTHAHLVLSADTARPGDTIVAGVHLQMDPGWHTYWQNPGASGMPTTIEWKLPPGITAGAAQWPIPEKLVDTELTTYIYRDEVVVLVPLRLDPNLNRGVAGIKALASWLECDVQCVPGHASVQADLNIGAETRISVDAGLIAAWEKKLPKPASTVAPRARWEKPPTTDLRPVTKLMFLHL